MIEVTKTLAVNHANEPVQLSVEQVWDGLIQKAENPLPYVRSITECTVTERFDGGLVREVIHVGQPVREVVTFYPKKRVHFVRTHGAAKGTIDNEIQFAEDGSPQLTFTFRIMIDGVEDGSPEEQKFAENMEADYLDAVQTTLRAARDKSTRVVVPQSN